MPVYVGVYASGIEAQAIRREMVNTPEEAAEIVKENWAALTNDPTTYVIIRRWRRRVPAGPGVRAPHGTEGSR